MHDVSQPAVILITGASGAIGYEIAARAAVSGAVVGLHGSRSERVRTAADRLIQAVPNAQIVELQGDFRTAGEIAAVVDRLVAECGRLDAVIHCAITGAPGATGPFRDTDPRSYAAHTAYTVGIFEELCAAAVPPLARQGGAIVALTSDAGRFAAPRQSIVGAAAGGLIAFVRNLAVEVARDGVRVNCIALSYVAETPIFARYAAATGGRGARARDRAGLGLPTPHDIAPLALFLCGAGSRKISGQVISVNGALNA